MDWKPDNITREAVGEFLENMVSVLPSVMGIDEVIAGCQVINLDPYGVGPGTYPRYIQVALRDRYYQDVMYRGGLTGLAVGAYVTVVHMRDGNRYELMTAGGSTGKVVNPAPAEAHYVTTQVDPLLTNEHVAQAGQWTAVTAAAGTFQTDFHPDNPAVVTGAGVVTEYASIQAAITAAVDCDTVLVPPGDYTEDVTLKNGVCVKGFGPRAKIRILGDEDVVTTAVGGWLENVTIVATDPPSDPGGLRQAVEVNHATGTCHFRSVTIEASSTANVQDWGAINTTGVGSGLLIADDLEVVVSATQAGSNAFGIRFSDYYELELKNFKVTVANTGAGAGDDAYGIMQMGSASVKVTEGWLDVTATGAGAAADLFGTITYSEIVNTADDTQFGQNVGVGVAPGAGYHLHIEDQTVDTTISYAGIYNYHIKTAGATDAADDIWGIDTYVALNHNGSTIGYLRGGFFAAWILDGTVDDQLQGATCFASLGGANAVVNADMIGTYMFANLDAGTAHADVYGGRARVDIESGVTVDGDVYGHHVWVDDDTGVTGNVYMLYLDEQSGIDYGVYQNGTADNYFGGNVGIGYTTPTYQLDVWDNVAGVVVRVFNDGNNANRIGMRIQCGADADGGIQDFIDFRAGAGLFQGYLRNNAAGNLVLLDASDISLKENIRDYEFHDLKKRFKDIRYRKYTKRGHLNCSGYIAQELQSCFPQAVQEMHVDGETLLGVSQMSLIGPMMEMIKQLILGIDVLQSEVESLKEG